MKSGLYKTSSGIYKNLQRILLCIVFSVLSFIFSRLTFQNTFYALPLCTLAALSISIFAPNAAWGAVTVSAAVITLILLEQTFNSRSARRNDRRTQCRIRRSSIYDTSAKGEQQ